MTITADDYNLRVREAARHQALSHLFLTSPGGTLSKWTTTATLVTPAGNGTSPFDFGINPLTGQPFFSASVFQGSVPGSAAQPVYAVTVGEGCVNDFPASIEYLAQGDPRGWIMPDNYPRYQYLQKLYGQAYPFVDRPMWDDGTGAPFLLLTAPNANASDLGGFIKTPDGLRPDFFRTADMWARDLYQASVMVTVTPFEADPAEVNLAISGPRLIRWRVLCGQIPSNTTGNTNAGSGATGIATQELARIYLVRTPNHPELDDTYVQQIVFWDLMAQSILDIPLLEVIGLSAAAAGALDLGLLAVAAGSGSGAGLAIATAMVGLSAAVVQLVVTNVQQIIAATSGVAFWTV